MLFNDHSRLTGSHALLSASKPSWINYDIDKLTATFHAKQATIRGTKEHALAHQLIELGVRLPDNGLTLSLYVNDAIGYRMKSEQILFYSFNCYGTADSISFDERKRFLRIHDLKTGIADGSQEQLEVYMALFCLEYGFKPNKISAELRLYQHDKIHAFEPDPVDISLIMDRIVTFDDHLNELRSEVM